jgi:hypothetical protein
MASCTRGPVIRYFPLAVSCRYDALGEAPRDDTLADGCFALYDMDTNKYTAGTFSTTAQPPHSHHTTAIQTTKDGPPSSSTKGERDGGAQGAHSDPPWASSSAPPRRVYGVC